MIMADIVTMAERVIEKAKTFKWSEPKSELDSFWEEFKREAQRGDFKYYEEYADKIDEMVHQEIDRMLKEDHGIVKGTSEYSLYDRNFILSGIWRYIQDKAVSEEEEKAELNHQYDKEIQSFDQLRPTHIKEIVSRADEYILYMREHLQSTGAFMDFLEQYIKDYFHQPSLDDLELRKTAVELVDTMYCGISNLLIRDIHTNAYFGIIINRLFYELAQQKVLVFYILDNQLRDDRFKVAIELFGVSHFSAIHPYAAEKLEDGDGYSQLPGKEYKVVEKEIDDAVAQNKHICYIEKDSSVNYIRNVLRLAELCQNEYLCVFRNQPPGNTGATWLTGSFSGLID
jgi:hypothetical protein